MSIFAQSNSLNEQKTVILDKDQTIDHDYFAAGNKVIVDGTINGDAYIAGGQIDINGTVNGDLLVAGGQVVIRGNVSQNVRAVGGDILLLGEVGRNVTLAGGNLTIDKSASIAGNVVAVGGNINILSKVKDLNIAGGNARIEDEVLGNMLAGVETLAISQGATIHGNVEYWSNNKVNITPGAKIKGKTTFHLTQAPENMKKSSAKTEGVLSGISLFFGIISFLSSLILGILFVRLLPVYAEKIAIIVTTKFWISLLVGFIALIMTPVLILILMVTLIGIPLGFILLFAYGVIMYLSKIFVAFAIGKLVREKAKWNVNPIWTFIAGLSIYYVVGFIPVIGALMKIVVLLVGIGAIVMQKRYYYLMLRDKKFI